jgi:glutamine---fructose-6-phosphate transaminase (isomerizing)
MLLHGDRIDVLKAPMKADALMPRLETRRVLAQALNGARLRGNEGVAFMGHARMVTNGAAHTHENNHPVIVDGLLCLHNGIIVNDEAIWSHHPRLVRKFQVDTEALVAVIADRQANGETLAQSVISGMQETRGGNTIALASSRHDAVVLASTNGSLYWSRSESGHEVAFASERYIVEKAVGSKDLAGRFNSHRVTQVRPGEAYLIPLDTLAPACFLLSGSNAPLPTAPRRSSSRKIVDQHVAGGEVPRVPHLDERRVRSLQKLLKVDRGRIRALRRCTQCILPGTFPFITFDEQGVCSICRAHKSFRQHTAEDLHARVAHLKQTGGGDPNCLVPLSGGRDSSYGLHYVKTVLGLKPVAYTYDWGMITDLARRNISRMCGALGVEHVIVSADIRQKRDFIRMNVAAWLNRPHLGTVPLFMAGDKQYFYYADLLKRRMKLQDILFSANPLERTDFKIGFCGINENYRRDVFYAPNVLNRLRLGLFYAKEFALNPSYLNGSLVDTIVAFWSYYFLTKDYVSIYDYVAWDEKHIMRTLRDQYDWETAADTKSTWRIGDGTAAFYNYIYYRVAGFTENDTFRSNQIREGLLSRETALATLLDENEPRPESLLWYFDTIGLEASRPIEIVNRLPQRY